MPGADAYTRYLDYPRKGGSPILPSSGPVYDSVVRVSPVIAKGPSSDETKAQAIKVLKALLEQTDKHFEQ